MKRTEHNVGICVVAADGFVFEGILRVHEVYKRKEYGMALAGGRFMSVFFTTAGT